MEKLKNLILGIASKLQPLAPLAARITIGLVFIPTGWGKLHHLHDVIGFFKSLGIPAPEIQAPFVATVELVFGLFVLLGLFTRLAVIPLMGTMVVAILTAKLQEITAFNTIFTLSEFLYIVLLFWLFTAGAGAISLDQRICRRCAGTQSN